jgi:hypothetical protein
VKATFLEAKMALVKQFAVHDELTGETVDKAYPKAANFITHTHEVETIDQYHAVLSDAASKWYGMLKGEPLRQLTEFSDRKGLTDRSTKTHLLVLDVDGLPWDRQLKSELGQIDVIQAAQWIVKLLPEAFQDVSYVAAASSSFGRKPGLRMHLHFYLETPVMPEVLRGVITMLNFNVPYINDQMQLTPAGRQLSYPIDPCMADNSRIVYIAPPIFGRADENPFKKDSDRIVLVNGRNEKLDLQPLIEAFSGPELLKRKEKRLKQLMAEAGIEFVKQKTVSINHRGTVIRVLQNPEQMQMDMARITDEFVQYNINGGDSNAYWVWMDNPDIVYSFKPDEMPFRFKTADPEAYAAHIEQFGKLIERAAARENENGDKVVPMMVMDRMLNAILTVEYDPFNDVVTTSAVNSKDNAENWMLDRGIMPADPTPAYTMLFDPTSGVGHDLKRRILNTYVPSKAMKESPMFSGDPLSFGDAEEWMREHAPICATVIMNMVGDDALCFEQFVNWFAFMVQRREKPETAWVVHGVEGTGKGLFIKRIAKPILGERYVIEKKLRDISDDKYNGYMAEALLLFVDEFNMNDGHSSSRAAANLLKQQITESSLTIREMQRNPTNRRTFFGMMFASNDVDSMRLSPTDRRYNVCPRQEIPLNRVIPDINLQRDFYDTAIAAEVVVLTSMLLAYEIEEHRVRTPLDNEAKVIAAEAGMTTDEVFFGALRKGNLEFFEPMATITLSPSVDLAKATILKRVAEKWIAEFIVGTRSKIKKDDLMQMFEFMTGYRINGISFGRKCKQQGLPESQFREGEVRYRGFEIEWKHKDIAYLKELLERSSNRQPGTNGNVVNLNGG